MRKFWLWIAHIVVVATAFGAPEPNQARIQIADGFDFPVGKPDAEGYYKARGFRPNGHLGEDWNGIGGGNSDFDNPVYVVAHGIVVYVHDTPGGWGNVIVVRHLYYEGGTLKTVDSLYAHLNRMLVTMGKLVRRGDQIGTIGTAHGLYPAHLHFEMHKNLCMGVSRAGFRRDFTNFYSPTDFIVAHRKLPGGGGRMGMVAINTFTGPGNALAYSEDRGSKSLVFHGESNTDEQPSSASPPKNLPSKKRSTTFHVDRFGDLDSL